MLAKCFMVETKSGLKLRYCAHEAIAGNCASAFHRFASVIQAWPQALSQPPSPQPMPVKNGGRICNLMNDRGSESEPLTCRPSENKAKHSQGY